jgi:hypothetical protein
MKVKRINIIFSVNKNEGVWAEVWNKRRNALREAPE